MTMYFIKLALQRLFPKYFILERLKNIQGVVLSFDDGPHPKHTPVILDELGKRNIKAAFFVTGSELEKYPELGKRIIDEGHLLGNHTFNHLNVKDVPFSEFAKSIEKAEKLIAQVSGNSHCKLFRPPYSSFSLKLILYVIVEKILLFNWTIDSRDSFLKDASSLIEYIGDLEPKNGDILLFHEDYHHTVEALPVILDQFRSRGIVITLPSFLLGRKWAHGE